VTWIPLHWTRFLARGFNQTVYLAKGVASENPDFSYQSLLEKSRYTAHQARLSREKRLSNVTGSYRVKQGIDLTGKTILLIDDVISTGSTFESCARALK
jgi:predicted amidophosphoribosyltransferase